MEMRASDAAGWVDRFEAVRRRLSWLLVSLFFGSFLGLLLLSGTVYWNPSNAWVVGLDRVCRISAIAWVVLWIASKIPRVTAWVANVFAK
jgi:hypothetical protein